VAAEAGRTAAAVSLSQPVDIGRAEARRAAAAELSEGRYEQESLIERAWRWFEGLVRSLVDQVAREGLGGALSLTLLVVVLAVLAALLLWSMRRLSASARSSGVGLLDEEGQNAAQHREQAARLAHEGHWPEAIRERLRAVARTLEEREILAALPGRTADELAAEAGRVLPALDDRLAEAARLFDAVTYGQHPGSAEGYAAVAALDDALLRAEPVVATP
jgi:Domain of unknown function (DUF4129)